MGFFISILPEKEREWSQGTVRWTQSVQAALDVMTRSTLFPGKEMFFSCLPARGGGQRPKCFLSVQLHFTTNQIIFWEDGLFLEEGILTKTVCKLGRHICILLQ